MFGQKFEKAFADWPYTKDTKDGGVRVTGRYWPPGLEDRAVKFVIIAGAACSLLATFGADGDIKQGVQVAIIFIVGWFIMFKRAAFQLFGKTVDVTIYRDRITLPGFPWERKYSREIPIEFRIEQHHRALTEKGQWRTYRDAIEAVMQYGEKRIPLAEMPEKDIELARAFLLRLQNVCERTGKTFGISEAKSGGVIEMGDFGPAPDIR